MGQRPHQGRSPNVRDRFTAGPSPRLTSGGTAVSAIAHDFRGKAAGWQTPALNETASAQMSTLRRVYFDHSATTPVDPRVLEAMMPYLTQKFGNASSVHYFGQEARAAIDRARREVAQL